eukprot:3149323-Prymnesium_polylepis.1
MGGEAPVSQLHSPLGEGARGAILGRHAVPYLGHLSGQRQSTPLAARSAPGSAGCQTRAGCRRSARSRRARPNRRRRAK